MAVGDTVYVIAFYDDALQVLGRLVVGEIISFEEAVRRLPYAPWEASDHLLATGQTSGTCDALVPTPDADTFEFITTDGSIVGIARRSSGRIEPQSFRGVREITRRSAEILDAALRAA